MFSLLLSINTAFLLTSVEHVKNNKKLLFFYSVRVPTELAGGLLEKKKKTRKSHFETRLIFIL